MNAELNERILESLRGLEIGESISADGIADEIGGKLSDVYDALEDLENAKLVEMHPACRKGSDPTYTLTPKGKRHMQPEVRERLEPEPAKEENDAPELRPSADRVCRFCRFCKKEMEPNKVRRHENLCGKNPDRPSKDKIAGYLKRIDEMPEAPAPVNHEEAESNATATLEHYQDPEPGILEQLYADDPDVPDEVPVLDEKAERIVGRIDDAIDRLQASDALVLKGSPSMDAALWLISFCQQALASGADVHLNASVKIGDGFYVSVSLEDQGRSQ